MQKIYFLASFCLLCFCSALGQNVHFDTIAELPETLREISGMTIGPNGTMWSLNDSGNEPELYQLNRNGEVIKTVRIKNAENQDWEELATAPDGRIFIGDFGNNRNNRTDLKIYIVREVDLIANKSVEAEIINFSYPDQKQFPAPPANANFDMEAMIFERNQLWLFSKNRTEPFTGFTNLYTLPTQPGTYVARKVDSLKLGDGPRELFQVTGADLSPNGNHLVLLSYDKLFVIYDRPYNDIFGGRLVQIDSKEISQRESVIWLNDSTLLVSDELNSSGGGFLYQLNIAQLNAQHANVRKFEVEVPIKEFSDTLLVIVSATLNASVFYEIFDGEGNRVDFGKLGEVERERKLFKIAPKPSINATYLLNIQVGNRAHGFFVYRHRPVDWEKVKSDFEERMREIEKQNPPKK